MTIEVGDKVILIPDGKGGYLAQKITIPQVGDKVILIPDGRGGFAATKSITPLVGDKVITMNTNRGRIILHTGIQYYLCIVYYSGGEWKYDIIEHSARVSGSWVLGEANCLPGNVCYFDNEIWVTYWYEDKVILAHKPVASMDNVSIEWTKETIKTTTSARESFVAASDNNIYVVYVDGYTVYCAKRASNGTLTYETVYSGTNITYVTDFDVSSSGYRAVMIADPSDSNRISCQFFTGVNYADLTVWTGSYAVNKSARVKFAGYIPYIFFNHGYDGNPYYGYWSAGAIVTDIISAGYGELNATDITIDGDGEEIQIFALSKSGGPPDLHLYSYNVAGEYWQFYQLQANVPYPLKGNMTWVENRDNYIYWQISSGWYVYFDPSLSPDTQYHDFPQTINTMTFHSVSFATRFYYGAAMDTAHVPYSMAEGHTT